MVRCDIAGPPQRRNARPGITFEFGSICQVIRIEPLFKTAVSFWGGNNIGVLLSRSECALDNSIDPFRYRTNPPDTEPAEARTRDRPRPSNGRRHAGQPATHRNLASLVNFNCERLRPLQRMHQVPRQIHRQCVRSKYSCYVKFSSNMLIFYITLSQNHVERQRMRWR